MLCSENDKLLDGHSNSQKNFSYQFTSDKYFNAISLLNQQYGRVKIDLKTRKSNEISQTSLI